MDKPEDTIAAAELAIKQFDLNKDIKSFRIRFFNLPKTQDIDISDIRSEHLKKMVQIEGLIRRKSDVRPQATSAKFECPGCGGILNVLQLDDKFREPFQCGCGRKGRFRLLDKSLVDVQRIIVEEAPERLEGNQQPKRISVFLKEDLVSPLKDKRLNPGSRIKLSGILKEIPIMAKDGGKLTRFDLVIDCNYIEVMDHTFLDVKLNKEDVDKLYALAKDKDIFKKLINSLAPSVFGHEEIKEAILYYIMGGVRRTKKNSPPSRGDIHMMLLGDPGLGKSMLLRRVKQITPKSRFISGKGASGVGLTATVVKDELMGGYALEAGALPLTNGGYCLIDELDKMTDEDRSAMHEALEEQTVTVSKGNVQATLRCETAVLAAANPEWGKFDIYANIYKQFRLPATLINRFDLIFPLIDKPDKSKDRKMVQFMLDSEDVAEEKEGEIDNETFINYVAYARQNIFPEIKKGSKANKLLEEFYVKMRDTQKEVEHGIKMAVPITPRQFKAATRLAQASARVRLSDEVNEEDVRRAMNIMIYCFKQIGMDPDTGEIDIERFEGRIPTSDKEKIKAIINIINDMVIKLGQNIPIKGIAEECIPLGIDELKLEEMLDMLKRRGDIYEPRPGYIQKMG